MERDAFHPVGVCRKRADGLHESDDPHPHVGIAVEQPRQRRGDDGKIAVVGGRATEVADRHRPLADEPAGPLGGKERLGDLLLPAVEKIRHHAHRPRHRLGQLFGEKPVGRDCAVAQPRGGLDPADVGEPPIPGGGRFRVLVERVEQQVHVAGVEHEIVTVEQDPHALCLRRGDQLGDVGVVPHAGQHERVDLGEPRQQGGDLIDGEPRGRRPPRRIARQRLHHVVNSIAKRARVGLLVDPDDGGGVALDRGQSELERFTLPGRVVGERAGGERGIHRDDTRGQADRERRTLAGAA